MIYLLKDHIWVVFKERSIYRIYLMYILPSIIPPSGIGGNLEPGLEHTNTRRWAGEKQLFCQSGDVV